MRTPVSLAVVTALFLGGILVASVPAVRALASQDKKEKKERRGKKARAEKKKQEEAASALPQAGPEHALLKQFEGVWDAKVILHAPTGDETQSAVETNTLSVGGLWLIGDVIGDFAGTKFQGHSIMGYDTAKKKYVSAWVDSMGTYMVHSEGSFDEKGKVLTMLLEAPDMTGQIVKQKYITEIKGPDSRIFSIHIQGPDGNYTKFMTIDYARKK